MYEPLQTVKEARQQIPKCNGMKEEYEQEEMVNENRKICSTIP